jgi:dGTPase
MAALGEKPDCNLPDKLRTRAIRRLIGIEITDAIRATATALAERGVSSIADIRQAGSNLACFSDELQEINVELKAFLMMNFYRHPRVVRMAYKANHMLTAIFNAYLDEPRQLPREIQARMVREPERVVCDYIAGMTDRFAILEYKRLFDPEARV